MAYDRELADRVRDVLTGEDGLSERAMFGGLAFLVHGHVAVVASGQGGLMVRVPPEDYDALLGGPVRPVEMRGREMRGWLRVEPVAGGEELERWVRLGLTFARSLPAKAGHG